MKEFTVGNIPRVRMYLFIVNAENISQGRISTDVFKVGDYIFFYNGISISFYILLVEG